jgi:hypothetical protein
MRKLEFKKKEESKNDKIFLLLDFEGGDADTEHPEYEEFNFKFSEWEQNIDEIARMVQKYESLKRFLSSNTCPDKEDDEELFYMYENAPYDPQGDWQNKCYLSSISVIGYDAEGNKWQSYT